MGHQESPWILFFYYCKFSLFCRSKAIKIILFLVTSFVFFLIGIFPFHLKLIDIKLHTLSFHNIFQEYIASIEAFPVSSLELVICAFFLFDQPG